MTAMFESVQYPNCLAISQDVTQATWFSPNIQARVIPLGQFNGIQGNVEYLYGLTCPTSFNNQYLALKSNTLQFLTVENNIASFKSLGMEFVMEGENPAELSFSSVNPLNLTYIGYAAFDENCQICGYEANAPHVELTFPLPTSPESQNLLIYELCTATCQFCLGANSQWANFGECVNALSAKPFANLADGDQDTIACRLIHIRLAAINPQVHCPHVGLSGGNACYNKDPNVYANQNFFQCGNFQPGPPGPAFVAQEDNGLTTVEETSIIVAGAVVVILGISFMIGFFMFKKSRNPEDHEKVPLVKF